MKCHLSAIELKRDGRLRAFDDPAARGLEQGLNPCPLDASVDWIGGHPLEGLALGSVRAQTKSIVEDCAINGAKRDTPSLCEAQRST